jgi:hypothetical protein
MKKSILVVIALVLMALTSGARAQTGTLLDDDYFPPIRAESLGEGPLEHFQVIQNQFSGFSPSKSGDQIAEYPAGRAREFALSDVTVEAFPAVGARFSGRFAPSRRGKPSRAHSRCANSLEPATSRKAERMTTGPD